jgi:precorrin-6A/cobalt-precorrin-6A reductase
MTGPRTVLLLGGTTEATAVASALGSQPAGSVDLTVSFAGRTRSPSVPFGRIRVGGFGGADGLAAYLRAEGIGAVVDALHPFAAVMPFHAHLACRAAGVPLVKVVRPPWSPSEGDRWTVVGAMADVPRALDELGARRVLLTVGRQELDPFRTLTGVRFLVRSIEEPDLTGPWDATGVLARGPFTEAAELALLQQRAIDAVVTKNSRDRPEARRGAGARGARRRGRPAAGPAGSGRRNRQ